MGDTAMDNILFINGKVKYPITLDPSVWIFDDRKVDLLTYFQTPKEEQDKLEEYKKNVSKHWDREIREGAVFPPVNKSISRFEKERIITGTFGMPLRPFLLNAGMEDNVTSIELRTETNTYILSIEEAMDSILGFSKDGKPLQEDGPVHFYFGNGSNANTPITHVRQFTVL
jgi:hypothetical protein